MVLVLLLVLLRSFMKAGRPVNKCGCRLLSPRCFHTLGLPGSLKGTAVLSAVSNHGKKKVHVRREELSLFSQTYEHSDPGRRYSFV